MKCPHCGLSHPYGTKFCPVTGEEISNTSGEGEEILSPSQEDETSLSRKNPSMQYFGLIVVAIFVVGSILLLIFGFSNKSDVFKVFDLNRNEQGVFFITGDQLTQIKLEDQAIINVHFLPSTNQIILVYPYALIVLNQQGEDFILENTLYFDISIVDSYLAVDGQSVGILCDREFILIDLNSYQENRFSVDKFNLNGSSISLSKQGRYVAFLLTNGQANIWDIYGSVWINLAINKSEITSLSFCNSSPDQIYILERDRVHLWSLSKSQEIHSTRLEQQNAKSVVCSPDDGTFLILYDNYLEAWSRDNTSPVYRFSLGDGHQANYTLYVQNQTLIILLGYKGMIVDLNSGELIQEFIIPQHHLKFVCVFPGLNRIYFVTDLNQILSGYVSGSRNDLKASIILRDFMGIDTIAEILHGVKLSQTADEPFSNQVGSLPSGMDQDKVTEEPTATHQPTQAPSATPSTVSEYKTPTPKAYFPISDCAASQLYIGDSAYVSYVGGTNKLRRTPDTHPKDNITGEILPGDVVEIIGGPECNYGWVLWKVRTTDDESGWTPESDGNEFWLIPIASRELCSNSLPSRLFVGAIAFVEEEPDLANRVRSEPNTEARIIDRIEPKGKMTILEGPECGEGTTWWKIKSFDSGTEGWTMESRYGEYYLAPIP